MESTGGMSFDKQIDEIEMDITIALYYDDLDTLMSLVDITPLFMASKYFSVCHMLENICENDAVNCATSLLEGELRLETGGVDVNMPLPGLGQVFPLHYAAKHACPEVLQLFLSRGAQNDIELYDPLNMWAYVGLLPLEIALDVVREKLSEESDIWPEPSTFQLIASLCLPSMKDSLKAVELLASSSKNIEKIAYYYAMDGHLFELAVLLTVAREKVFAPITFSRQNGDNWNGRMTLEQWLKMELGLLHIQESKVLEPFAEKKSTWIERKKRLLESIALLLDVFGKAGNAVEEYMKLERHCEDVKTDVALRLVEAGCRLKDGDFDFNIVYWMNSGGSRIGPIEYQRIGVPFSPRWPSPTRWNSLSRESTGGMNIDDQINQIERDITIALYCDDVDALISLVEINISYRGSKYLSACEMVEGICKYNAVNCATSLLEGELGLVMRGVNVNTPVPGLGELFPLHYAAKHACPEVVQLFLSRGAQTDIILYDPLCRWGYNGLFPLEIALDVAREKLSKESDIWPEPSTFQLIASLCLPDMKDSLKAVELLASSSKNIEKTAYYYAIDGNLVELAVLLTVARKKVLAPITFSRQSGDKWDGRMTLDELLKYELRSLYIQERRVVEPFEKNKLARIERKERLLESIALLLDIFGKAGDAIEEYMKLERHCEDVEKDVALRLVEAGCRFKDGDFDFDIVYWMDSGGRSSILRQQIGVSFSIPHWPSPTTWKFLSSNGMFPCNGYGSSSWNYASKRTHSHVPKSNFGSHYSMSSDFQVKNRMKTMEQGLPKYLPMEKLAYISIMIKKWIRNA